MGEGKKITRVGDVEVKSMGKRGNRKIFKRDEEKKKRT